MDTPMKLSFRMPSLRKSMSARLSGKRRIENTLGMRAPRCLGWLINPKKAAYNRVYDRTSFSIWRLIAKLLG